MICSIFSCATIRGIGEHLHLSQSSSVPFGNHSPVHSTCPFLSSLENCESIFCLWKFAISCEWNYKICSLLWVASFPHQVFRLRVCCSVCPYSQLNIPFYAWIRFYLSIHLPMDIYLRCYHFLYLLWIRFYEHIHVLCEHVLSFLSATYARGDLLDPLVVLCSKVAVPLDVSTSMETCLYQSLTR